MARQNDNDIDIASSALTFIKERGLWDAWRAYHAHWVTQSDEQKNRRRKAADLTIRRNQRA